MSEKFEDIKGNKRERTPKGQSKMDRLCQRLYHFYHILTAFNKLKSMSEVVPLLPHTDCLQQVEEYVRGCTTSTTY
jgi:hypothetical protein